MSNGEVEYEREPLRCSRVYYWPIINIFYDLFFDDAPTMEQVLSVMNVFGLLNGLLLGVAFSILNLFQNGDAKVSKERNFAGATSGNYDDYETFSIYGFAGISMALMCLIVLYIFSGTISFQDSKGKYVRKAFSAWWAWNRWLFVLQLILTAVGAAFLFQAAERAFVLQHADTEEASARLRRIFDLINFIGFALIAIIIPVVLLSGGLRAKQAVIDREEAAVAAKTSATGAAAAPQAWQGAMDG